MTTPPRSSAEIRAELEALRALLREVEKQEAEGRAAA